MRYRAQGSVAVTWAAPTRATWGRKWEERMGANQITRRAASTALAAAAGLTGVGPRRATAQEQQPAPTLERVARLVVGLPPGGSADTFARLYS